MAHRRIYLNLLGSGEVLEARRRLVVTDDIVHDNTFFRQLLARLAEKISVSFSVTRGFDCHDLPCFVLLGASSHWSD